MGPVPEERGRIYSIKTEQGGQLWRTRSGKVYPAAVLDKARAHWARKQAMRKEPGHCGRCGQPNPEPSRKHCPACRAYQVRYKASKQALPVTVDRKALARLERRIAALEHNFAMMRLDGRAIYRRGYRSGAKGESKRAARAKYFDAYPTICQQELAAINHAYDQPD